MGVKANLHIVARGASVWRGREIVIMLHDLGVERIRFATRFVPRDEPEPVYESEAEASVHYCGGDDTITIAEEQPVEACAAWWPSEHMVAATLQWPAIFILADEIKSTIPEAVRGAYGPGMLEMWFGEITPYRHMSRVYGLGREDIAAPILLCVEGWGEPGDDEALWRAMCELPTVRSLREAMTRLAGAERTFMSFM